MCLSNEPSCVKEILNGPDIVEGWKFYEKGNRLNLRNSLFTPYQGGPLSSGGVIVSDNQRPKPCLIDDEVSHAIHGFRTREACIDAVLDFERQFGTNTAILKFTAHKDDIIGANEKEIAFHKITISDEEFTNAKRKGTPI